MKKTIISLCLFTLISLGVYFSYKSYQKDKDKKELQSNVTSLLERINLTDNMSFHKKIDSIRVFINDHSAHNINNEFYRLWKDDNLMIEQVLNYYDGTRSEYPPMECSTRRVLMSNMLHQLGFRTRSIDIYRAREKEKLKAHSILDVFNPETNSWETQDPDYDIYWREKETKKRVSLAQVISNVAMYEPCNRFNKCGWGIKSRENIKAAVLKDYLNIVSVIDKPMKERYSLYHKDLSPQEKYQLKDETGTFCELIAKNCRKGFRLAK